jgi:hypothetical protein
MLRSFLSRRDKNLFLIVTNRAVGAKVHFEEVIDLQTRKKGFRAAQSILERRRK